MNPEGILGPVPPVYMDPGELKAKYGSRLAFWGAIGSLREPDDLWREVELRIETVGRGGGLWVAPAPAREAEIPWASVVALKEAVARFGACR